MSDLKGFGDYCRKMAKDKRTVPIPWTEKERAMWAMLADEVDAHRDPDDPDRPTVEDDPLPGF